jgi:small subunit ribosomal protein S11
MVKKVAAKTKITSVKKKKKIVGGSGRVTGSFSFNNSILSLTENNGNVLTQVSSGSLGYRGTKKATAFAAQNVAKKIIQEATDYGIHNVKLQVKGIGAGRDAMIKEVLKSSLNVEELIDKTPVSFGGCRPPKKPRK